MASWNPLRDLREELNRNLRRLDQNLFGGSYTGKNATLTNDLLEKAEEKRRELNDVPTLDDPEVEEARRNQRRRYGRAATLLTGGQGLTTPAPTVRRTLLGF